MPKALDFRIKGLTFKEAGKRIANSRSLDSKKSKQKTGRKIKSAG
jgi:hypothetical protein